LQTFPTDFQFRGTPSERLQLIGNAVPPLLAEAIARSIWQSLNENQRTLDEVALLSVVPTASAGMSPALAHVTEQVQYELAGPATAGFVEALWH